MLKRLLYSKLLKTKCFTYHANNDNKNNKQTNKKAKHTDANPTPAIQTTRCPSSMGNMAFKCFIEIMTVGRCICDCCCC